MTEVHSIRLLNDALDALEQHYGPTHTITAIEMESDTTDCFNYRLTKPDGTETYMYSRVSYNYKTVPVTMRVGYSIEKQVN